MRCDIRAFWVRGQRGGGIIFGSGSDVYGMSSHLNGRTWCGIEVRGVGRRWCGEHVLYSYPCAAALFERGYLDDTSLFFYMWNVLVPYRSFVFRRILMLAKMYWNGMGECKIGITLDGVSSTHVRSSIGGTCIPLAWLLSCIWTAGYSVMERSALSLSSKVSSGDVTTNTSL
jgi:hypothetical protein